MHENAMNIFYAHAHCFKIFILLELNNNNVDTYTYVAYIGEERRENLLLLHAPPLSVASI